jgi:hypothetical protein
MGMAIDTDPCDPQSQVRAEGSVVRLNQRPEAVRADGVGGPTPRLRRHRRVDRPVRRGLGGSGECRRHRSGAAGGAGVKRFAGSNGATTQGALVVGAAGALYGTTTTGANSPGPNGHSPSFMNDREKFALSAPEAVAPAFAERRG